MKEHRLFDAITDLPDEIVSSAAYTPPRKKRLRKWHIPAVAAILAICYFVGSAIWPDGATIGMVANAAYLAEYPDRAKAVNNTTINQSKVYEEWRDEQRALRLPEDFDTSGIDSFTRALVQEFFGSNVDQNRVCSPINIYMALAMLAETTAGNTRAQLLDLLGESDVATLRTKANTLFNNLYRDDGKHTVIPANSLWLRDDNKVEYVDSTLKTLAENYYASSFAGKMGSESYNQALRDWMNEQTKGLLSDQINELGLEKATIMALVSTIYYKGTWSSEFNKNRNTVGVFYGVKGEKLVDYMNQSSTMAYYWSDNFAATYKNLSQSGMWLVLPDEGVSPEELLLSDSFWDMVQGGSSVDSKNVRVDLSVPKFDVSDQIDLTEALQALGITDAFDWTVSDFTPLTTDMDEIYVSQALHGARLKIDEEGAEGAAYTIISKGAASDMPPDDWVQLKLDRPFVLVLTNVDGLPLFVGIVHSPQ